MNALEKMNTSELPLKKYNQLTLQFLIPLL